jgi:hypothetical protein
MFLIFMRLQFTSVGEKPKLGQQPKFGWANFFQILAGPKFDWAIYGWANFAGQVLGLGHFGWAYGWVIDWPS